MKQRLLITQNLDHIHPDIYNWCTKNNHLFSMHGTLLPEPQATQLREIGITPKMWTLILTKRRAITYHELVQICRIIGASLFEVIPENHVAV